MHSRASEVYGVIKVSCNTSEPTNFPAATNTLAGVQGSPWTFILFAVGSDLATELP